MKRTFTREEKIQYYEKMLERAERRLKALRDPDYQDWNSELSKELLDAKKIEKVVRELIKKGAL